MFKILVTGDLVVNKQYDVHTQIDSELLALFANSQLNISNLEAPVTDSDSKILKTGPYVKSDKKSVEKVLKALNINLVTLANNHVLDYDQKGVTDTIQFCEQLNIQTVGAGANLKEAARTHLIETIEGKIAIVNFAENEWSSATNDTAGANPMDMIDNTRQIQEAKEIADFVVVIVHGGHEYYNLPSPRMQKQYRFYVDQGADIVVSHHTHCMSGYEEYKGAPIYYSLGNFLFTKPSKKDDWYLGLLLHIEINQGKLSSFVTPVAQQPDSFNLSVLKGIEKEAAIKRFNYYNSIINNEENLLNEWKSYVASKRREYLNCWSPFSYIDYSYLPAIFNRLKFTFSNKKGASLYLNLMRCETHYDISKEILSKYLRR